MVNHEPTMQIRRRTDEWLRRAAAGVTEKIALRHGREIGMTLACGYPKSGTVWLSQLLASYLAVPYPREYRSPIAMPSVIHSHWPYDERLPRAVYITRDGRDVMVSLYFYYMRALELPKSPRRVADLHARFRELYGNNFNPNNVRENLPRFIEKELSSPRGTRGLSWHMHVQDWITRPSVIHTSYEALLQDTPQELTRIVSALTDTPPNPHRISASVELNSFQNSSGRPAGTEDRGSFLRKGVAGDWQNYFTREAGQVLNARAGDLLRELGYESDPSWVEWLDS